MKKSLSSKFLAVMTKVFLPEERLRTRLCLQLEIKFHFTCGESTLY